MLFLYVLLWSKIIQQGHIIQKAFLQYAWFKNNLIKKNIPSHSTLSSFLCSKTYNCSLYLNNIIYIYIYIHKIGKLYPKPYLFNTIWSINITLSNLFIKYSGVKMFALTGKHVECRLINFLQRECLICNLYELHKTITSQ